jgi:quercetin dioxygenase-like cupin family protein
MLDGIASSCRTTRACEDLARGIEGTRGQDSRRSRERRDYEGGHWLGSFATYLVTRRGIGPEVVPVYREPMHRLVLQNRYARVMDVLIPPGETSKDHEHAARIAGVILSDARYWAQKPGEERGPLNVPLAPGSPIENWAAQLPYTHRVGNVDVVPLHYIVAEQIAPTRIDADALPDTATRKLIKEGAVARYYRITLEPGQSTEAHTHALPGITVHVADGAWQWRDPDHHHVLRNDGNTRVVIVEVDLR